MHRQRGITLIGWLVLLIPLAIVVYAGIRVTPVYLNYLNVARTLNEVASTYGSDANPPSLSTIRESISEHFTVDEVNYPTVNDIQITRNGSGWHLEAAYDDYAPLFGPVSLQIQFDKTVTFGNGG